MAGNDYQTRRPPAEAGDNRADEVKALARDHAELAISTLASVAGDGLAKDSARVKAADVLLQRGFGAPERRVEQNTRVEIYDERQAHLDAMKSVSHAKDVTPPPRAKPNDTSAHEFAAIEHDPDE